jgi:hypothetical protein
MINKRFAYTAFAALGRNTPESEALAQELQVAISDRLLEDIRRLGEKIAGELAALGHETRELEFESDTDGRATVTFADTTDGASPEQWRLRFSLDLIVSAGFPSSEGATEASGIFDT